MARSSDDTVSVSEAVEPDIDAFADFFTQAWRQSGPEAPGFTGGSDDVVAELTAPDAIRTRIGGPDRRMFLAWQGERVVGFSATKRLDDDTVELAGIIVLPSHSGRGIGTALVAAAFDQAVRERYKVMIVRTETVSHTAKEFYERRGFETTGITIEQVDDTPVDVWELARRLPERR